MTELTSQAQHIFDAFQAAKGWEQRARLLLQFGQQLPPLADAYKTEANLIRGCESPVWCHVDLQDNRIHLQLDTDARLLKGLLAVLQARIQGLHAHELQSVDVTEWFNTLGLARQLSPSRSNGLTAVLTHINQILLAQ